MTCRRARAAIHKALDERAAQWPPELSEHLMGCAGCERTASELTAVGDAARQLATPTPSDAYFRDMGRRAVAGARWSDSPNRARDLRLSWGSAAACAAALLVGGVLAGHWLVPGPEGDVVIEHVSAPTSPGGTSMVVADESGGVSAPGAGVHLADDVGPPSMTDEALPDLPTPSVSPPPRGFARPYVPPRNRAPRTIPVHHVATPVIEDPIGPAFELPPFSTFSGETVVIEINEGEVLGPFDPTGLMPTQPLDRGTDTVVPALDIAPEHMSSSHTMRGA